jgi:hypothetical protein
MTTVTKCEVNETQIQIDRSGQGHNWRDATTDDTPENIREEIAAEILDGKIKHAKRYVASNGMHYRW